MKAITIKVALSLILVLALLTTSIAGCQSEDTVEAPTLPPLTSFVIDFDVLNSEGAATPASYDAAAEVQQAGFTFGDDDLFSSGQYAAAGQQNWNFAAGNVLIWSAFILLGLAVPTAAFVGAFQHTPQQQEDYTWRWSYEVQVGQDHYTAELHGKFIDDYDGTDPGVRWEMYISKQGGYTDFEWYYGESNLPATEGFWILKNKPTDPTDLVQIDWERNLSLSTYSITYTNIVPGGPENGGYISHGATTDESYDRFYEIHNESANTYTYIEWNSTTQEGRVKASHHFGNDQWHYWDSGHNDIQHNA
ncbi:hypothetical protein ACFLXA_01795 [Chloroflexota bacterium]